MNATELNDFTKGFGPMMQSELYDLKQYSKEVHDILVDGEDKELSVAANAFIKQRLNLKRYSRILPLNLKPRSDWLAMLDMNVGYRTFKEKSFWTFMKDLYEDLYREVPTEEEKNLISTLLINYSKMYPYTTLIHFNPDYVVDHNHYDQDAMEYYSSIWEDYEGECLRVATIEDAKFRVKKTTAIGFPNETVDGIPIERDDYLYGLEDDAMYIKTRYRKDLSKIKLGYYIEDHGSRRIFREQCEAARRGVTPENIGELIDKSTISVCSAATRENCPDRVIANGVFNFDDIYYCRDRNFSVHHSPAKGSSPNVQTHRITVGVIDSKKYNTIAQRVHRQPGAANRVRGIFPSNNMSHGIWTGYARIATHKIESSCSGMPSNKPIVMRRWRNFYEKFSDSHDIYVFFGDCKNAELTVTSNFQLFMKTVPKPIRPYLDITSCTLQNTRDGFHVTRNSYCSAVWYTTYFHIHKGNFEAIRLINTILRQSNVHVFDLKKHIREQLNSLIYGTEYAQIGDNSFVCPFLGTDDMMMPFAVPKGSNLKTLDESMLKSTMMSAGFTKEGNVAFGMMGRPESLTENESSRLSKLFTSEHMGDVYRDGMATYERIHNCGYTDVVDHNLRKHFGYDHSAYYICEQLFLQRLEKQGVNIGDVFDIEHSPVGKMLFGKFVTGDPIYDSSLVPDVYAEKNALSIKRRVT